MGGRGTTIRNGNLLLGRLVGVTWWMGGCGCKHNRVETVFEMKLGNKRDSGRKRHVLAVGGQLSSTT